MKQVYKNRMTIIRSVVIGIVGFVFCSCYEDVPIGDSIPVSPDYILPQGAASQAANNRVQEIYNTYGSYLLYAFSQSDFDWTIASGSSAGAEVFGIPGDPEYVEDMIQLIDAYWIKFFPDNFLKGAGFPYRVFLTDTIKQYRTPGVYNPMQRNELFYPYRITGMSLAFTGTNRELRTLDEAGKLVMKNKIQAIVWRYYFEKKLFDFTNLPDRFAALSDYTTAVTAAAAQGRGFIPQITLSATSSSFMLDAPVVFNITSNNWFQSATTRNIDNDVFAYATQLTQKTTEELEALKNANDTIREKFEIVQAHFLSKYSVNLSAIGNTR